MIRLKNLSLCRTNIEDRPLETQKLRDQRMAKEERKYGFTIIRLSFPFDHIILQTIFKPNDKIEELKQLAKEFVNVDDFYLYTAPPKKVLDDKSTFFKERLCPAALIQFGGHQKSVLKDNFKQQVSSFANVVSFTSFLREKLRNPDQSDEFVAENAKNQTEQSTDDQDARAKKEERLMKLLMKK